MEMFSLFLGGKYQNETFVPFCALPQSPREPWSWWPRWPTAAGWSWERHAAASCTHPQSGTSPAQHETASPHLPVARKQMLRPSPKKQHCISVKTRWNSNSNKSTYPLQNVFPVVTELHEQGNFPAGVTVEGIHLQQWKISIEDRLK